MRKSVELRQEYHRSLKLIQQKSRKTRKNMSATPNPLGLHSRPDERQAILEIIVGGLGWEDRLMRTAYVLARKHFV